jgi:hypothetical protein
LSLVVRQSNKLVQVVPKVGKSLLTEQVRQFLFGATSSGERRALEAAPRGVS